jgi:hypothetical protein
VEELRAPTPDVLPLHRSELDRRGRLADGGLVDYLGPHAARALAIFDARARRVMSCLSPGDAPL